MNKRASDLSWYTASLTAVVALAGFNFFIGGFLPNRYGKLGHDYSYVLTRLLDGYYWSEVNGILKVPWFTPSFCGGLPAFGSTNNFYYSIPQFFTFFVDPLSSVYFTILLFALIGFAGFYLLAKEAFGIGQGAALYGSLLFMFNGFYMSRMIIGHFMYHAFALVPLICFFMLRQLPSKKPERALRIAFDSVLAAIGLGYMVYSGMSPIGAQMILAILVVGLTHSMVKGGGRAFIIRLFFAGLIATILSAAKLAATAAFLQHFPRDQYPVAGVDGFLPLVYILVRSLFFWPDMNAVNYFTVNTPFMPLTHELEYGITPGPLLIICFGVWVLVKNGALSRSWKSGGPGLWMKSAAMAIMFCLVIALNYRAPFIEAVVKSLPVLKNQHFFFRWFIAFVPVAILTALIFIERIEILVKFRRPVIIGGVILLLVSLAMHDREFYQKQNYPYEDIIGGYYLVKEGARTPLIETIGAYTNSEGKFITPVYRDNLLTRGSSQAFCYEAIFGYRLENFPINNMKIGRVMDQADGVLNLKNPACYQYPEENGCEPGDHFSADQRQSAELFRAYRPYKFAMSFEQKAANFITLAGFVLSGAFLAFYWLCLFKRKS